MIRIFGLMFLLISMFLILQSISTVYYDYDKQGIDETTEKKSERVYATVDRIGFLLIEKAGKWYNLPTKILIYLGILILSGLLMTFSPNRFPVKSINSLYVKKFLAVFSISFIIFTMQYLRYFNRNLPFGYGKPISTLVISISIVLVIGLILVGINKKTMKIFNQECSFIWLILASIMIANGFLIETYSWNNPTHNGDFAQFDYLGVAIYEGWSHNWTIAYTVFRVTNNILMIFGILLISVIVTRRKEVTSQLVS